MTGGAKDQSGVAAVEFALLLPVLFVFLFGTIEFGLVTYNMQVLDNASREGARAAIANGVDSDAVKAIVAAYCTDNLINLGGANSLDANNIVPEEDGDYMKVTVSYQYDYLFGSLVNLSSANKTLTGVTVMRKE